MKKNIAIYGAGGFGRETLEMIRQINLSAGEIWNPIGFFDDVIKAGTEIAGIKVLGSIRELNEVSEPLSLALTVASPVVRTALADKIKNRRINFPVLIHPSANTGSSENQLGTGTIVTAGVILTTHIKIEEFVIINLACIVGHDASIEKFSTLMPACHISGNVRVEKEVMIGTGASVLQSLTIGAGAQVGAGAVVTKSVKPGATVVGVPAKERQNV